MKKNNILLIISIILFLASVFFVSMEYLEKQSEKVDLFYCPIEDEDINVLEKILGEEGLVKDEDYEISMSLAVNPEFKVKNGKYIHIRAGKLFLALNSILNSGKSFDFVVNPYSKPESNGFFSNPIERKVNDNNILLNVFLNMAEVKRCAFDYCRGHEGLFAEEAQQGEAMVILELEDGFSLNEKQLDCIAKLTLGCNKFGGYYYFVPLENIVICNLEGKVLFGNEKFGEDFSNEEWFSMVKEAITDRPLKTGVIKLSSFKIKVALGYFILSIIILIWYFIKLRKINSQVK